MLENGFVKLPREIITRKWFGDKNTLQLYIALLLKANFREGEFEGVRLKPGQLITSVAKLTEITCQSTRQTRTALNHLIETNDITIQTTPKFSIITLNYGFEKQLDDKLVDKPADKQCDKQNDNNRRREKEEGIEESIKEEREEAASPSSPLSCENSFISNEDLDLTGFKARLVKEYGSELVRVYEAKFKAWSSAKSAANIPMYPTIAKWLAMDAAPKAPKSPNPPKASPTKSSKPSEHIDTNRLRAAVMAGYKKQAGE